MAENYETPESQPDQMAEPAKKTKKMSKKGSSAYLAECVARLKASQAWRKKEGYDATWERMNDMYKGKQFSNAKPEDRVLVNVSFSTVNVIAPSISVNYPKITVNAQNPDNAPQAVIAEAVVNYQWRHRNVRPHFRRVVKDMIIFGHGWLKAGWRLVEEADTQGGDTEVSDPMAGGEATALSVILEDGVFVERVSINDIFVDPDATSMQDIRWIAQRLRRPIKDIRDDKRYNKMARDMVKISAVGKHTVDASKKQIQDKSQGYAEVWEFYDIASNQMSVFSNDCEHFLIDPIKLPYSFGQPFVMLRNYDVPDYFYPVGDLEIIEPLQNELNETRSQMMNHRKKYAAKWLYDEDAFDSQGRTMLESTAHNAMVPVRSDKKLDQVIMPMPAVISPPEFYNQSQMILTDMDRISAVSEFERGATPSIRRTATEASMMQDASNARTADKLASVEQAIGEVARRMVLLSQQFLSEKQVARIQGKDGEPFWVTYDRDSLTGDFDFEVVGGSTQPNNESFRRQSALQLVDAMAPFAQAGVINFGTLAAYVLQQGFGVKNPDMFIQEAPQIGPDGQPIAPDGQAPAAPPQGAPPA